MNSRDWDSIERRLARRESGCWEWTGPLTNGYGRVRLGGRTHPVHRLSYEHHVGPISEGLELDHLCRNKACANPAHLEAVTHRENLMRGDGPSAQFARRTHCNNGHEFTPENTRIERGGRLCRTCRNQSQREYKARKKERHG